MILAMKTKLFSIGELVRNTRSGEIGVIVKSNNIGPINTQINDDTIYYSVLSKDGKVTSWFKSHIAYVESEYETTNNSIR